MQRRRERIGNWLWTVFAMAWSALAIAYLSYGDEALAIAAVVVAVTAWVPVFLRLRQSAAQLK